MASNGISPHHPSLATSWISLSQLSITGSPQPSMKRNITSTSTSHPTQPILLGSPKAWSSDTSYTCTIFAQTVVISNINHKNFSNASPNVDTHQRCLHHYSRRPTTKQLLTSPDNIRPATHNHAHPYPKPSSIYHTIHKTPVATPSNIYGTLLLQDLLTKPLYATSKTLKATLPILITSQSHTASHKIWEINSPYAKSMAEGCLSHPLLITHNTHHCPSFFVDSKEMTSSFPTLSTQKVIGLFLIRSFIPCHAWDFPDVVLPYQ